MADERDFAYGGLASGRLWTGGKTQRDAQFTVEENMMSNYKDCWGSKVPNNDANGLFRAMH